MSKVTQIRPKAAAPVDTKLIARRVEAQRERIFQAMSIIATVNKVLDREGEVGDDAEKSPLWFALCGVHGLLDDVAGELNGVTRAREVAYGR